MNAFLSSPRPRRQMGVSLLEFIGFIGLAAVVLAGALALYNSARAGADATELTRSVAGVVASLRSAAGVAQARDLNLGAITPPLGWRPVEPAVWAHGRARLSFANHGNGTFSLALTGISDQAVVKQLVGKPLAGRDAAPAGEDGVVWADISF